MDFGTVFTAVLVANLMTVWAVWCFYHIFRDDKEAKITAQLGLVFILLMSASGVYIATQ